MRRGRDEGRLPRAAAIRPRCSSTRAASPRSAPTCYGVGDTPRGGAAARRSKPYLARLPPGPAHPRRGRRDRARPRLAARPRGRSRARELGAARASLAARLRERFGVPGMSRRHRARLPRQAADEGARRRRRPPRAARRSACAPTPRRAPPPSEIGYPLIAQADRRRRQRRHVPGRRAPPSSRTCSRRCAHVGEASCEEFIDGEEFTFDTVCIGGKPALRERRAVPAEAARSRARNEWISPVIITVRDLDAAEARRRHRARPQGARRARHGRRLHAHGVVPHAERRGVFGEIGCRPGGAHLVDQMNYTCDIDLFREWARAVVLRTRSRRRPTRKYNVGDRLQARAGPGPHHAHRRARRVHARATASTSSRRSCCRPGTPRRNWKQTLVSDGYVIVRHPDWDEALPDGRSRPRPTSRCTRSSAYDRARPKKKPSLPCAW